MKTARERRVWFRVEQEHYSRRDTDQLEAQSRAFAIAYAYNKSSIADYYLRRTQAIKAEHNIMHIAYIMDTHRKAFSSKASKQSIAQERRLIETERNGTGSYGVRLRVLCWVSLL